MTGVQLLIVDDNRQITSLLRMVLGRGGYVVRESHSGAEALELARRSRPDAILLDLRMPDMSGHDVIRRMEAEPELADVPVIVATGDTEVREVAGAFATLIKPIKIEQLQRVLQRALTAGCGA